jgi:hypothetical protein
MTEKLLAMIYESNKDIKIFRAPPPIENPQRGDVWPVYVSWGDSKKHDDTFMFIFYKEKWLAAGNCGGGYNWRYFEHRPKKILKELEKSETFTESST